MPHLLVVRGRVYSESRRSARRATRLCSGAQVETIFVGDRRIQIRTSVLEDKCTACNMLCCYADELKHGFLPWVQQVRVRAWLKVHPVAHQSTHLLYSCCYATCGQLALRPRQWHTIGFFCTISMALDQNFCKTCVAVAVTVTRF